MEKLKGTKLKLITLLLMIFMIISSATTSFAATQITLGTRSLSSYYSDFHNVIGWGTYTGTITVFTIGNEYAFCTQAGKAIRNASGDRWTGQSSYDASYDIATVTADNSLQSKIAYVGFLKLQEDPTVWNDQATRDWYYAMTQMMIWHSLPAMAGVGGRDYYAPPTPLPKPSTSWYNINQEALP